LDKGAFITACREGGTAIERALRVLDRDYFTTLYRECRRVVGDCELARDLVQDTFIKIWQRCATFQGTSELLPWMRSILRHTVLDALRRRAREVPLDAADPSTEGAMRLVELAIGHDDTPVRGAEAVEARACFERGWARFEAECPEHAAVIQWIAADGLDTAAIAALLERSPGATREYVSQCRKRARHYLADWYALAFGAVHDDA
jgi:RNA polymerase sigma-70 factor (ECF subfamily)